MSELDSTTMALTEPQQILETIKRAKQSLIVIPLGAGADGYASALGVARAFGKLKKPAEIVAADGPIPKQLRFLPDHDRVKPAIEGLETFTVKLKIDKTQVEELSYNIEGDELHIHLTPRSGTWNEHDLRADKSGYRYDLIISIGAQDLEMYKHLFYENADFFFSTPIINIDHSPANEHFGQYNLIDTTATAVSEVCHNFINLIEPSLLDGEIATCFLAGMIAKTKSFKTSNVTPRTLKTASKLMSKGAKREEIVENLFRTRSVETLRLWGRALARLKSDTESRLVWTLLSRQDFMHAGALESDLPDVVDELIASSPTAKIIVLLYEDNEGNVCAIVRAEQPHDAMALAAPFRPAGTREEAKLCFLDKNIVEVERDLISKLKTEIKA